MTPRPSRPKAVSDPQPIALWAWWRDDLWPHYFDVGEHKPSSVGTDKDGALYPRYGKSIRVEIRPLPKRRTRRTTKQKRTR